MKIVTLLPDEWNDNPQPLLGLSAIVAELATQGIHAGQLFARTDLAVQHLADDAARMTLRQRILLYRNALRHARRPDTALMAGVRQRISDYGIYGYALASSATLREAMAFGVRHLRLAGPTMQVQYRIESGVAVLSGHGFQVLGDVLVFSAEFWRASIVTLLSRVMEGPVPTQRMIFPYRAPSYWRSYERIFGCPVDFVEGVMEWHLREDALDQPCPNANPITSQMCQRLCERMVQEQRPEEGTLIRKIRTQYVNAPGRMLNADEMAQSLGMSARSMYRRLATARTSYQAVIDDVRHALATEFLRDTSLSTQEVARRLGYSEATNFRKAFKRWSGTTPSDYRASRL